MGLEGENLIYTPPRIIVRRGLTNSTDAHIVRPGDFEEITAGYIYQELELEDNSVDIGSALHMLKPHRFISPSRIMEDIDCLETVIHGEATFLAQDPLGRIHDLHLSSDMQKSIRYGKGWTVTLIGRTDSIILGVYSPLPTAPMRQPLEIPRKVPKKVDRNGLHPRYWDRFKTLTRS